MKLLFCILFLCYLCSTSQAGKLSLIGNAAFHSTDCEINEAKLAIDGKVDTFSLCVSDQYTRGSWEVDLGGKYEIGQVIVTASSDINYAKYLQVFSIWLIDEDRLPHLCYKYNSTEHLAPLEIRSFPCKNYHLTIRSIRIARDGGKFRPEAIALAEVNVVTGLPPSMIEADGDEIQLAGKNAIQSNFLMNSKSYLAIDGNLKTSVVVKSQFEKGFLMWWKVDLGKIYKDIGKVILTANNYDNELNLKDYVIFLVNEKNFTLPCKGYGLKSLGLSETRPFTCLDTTFDTRYIKIHQSSRNFALAEVKVKTRSSFFSITPTSEFRTDIPLAGKKTEQSQTWENRVGNFATDGNLETFSVAESPKNKFALGWWEVDLEGNYQVGEVFLTSSIDKQYADYLCEFSIWLLGEDRREQHLCKNYTLSESFHIQETRSFLCDNEPFMTRYVRISKLDGSHRKDAVALAEVRVMSGFHRKN